MYCAKEDGKKLSSLPLLIYIPVQGALDDRYESAAGAGGKTNVPFALSGETELQNSRHYRVKRCCAVTTPARVGHSNTVHPRGGGDGHLVPSGSGS